MGEGQAARALRRDRAGAVPRRAARGVRHPGDDRRARQETGRVIGARDAHVWHCSLSLHPQEPELADERWAEICEQFIEQMRFAGETAKAQCRWVAIRHGRSAGGSDHAHLVVTLVAEDGSKASVHNDRPRAQKACRELEQRFGLRRLEARTREAGSRGLKHGELAADRRRGRQLGDRGEHPERSSRQTLERIVRACATASRDESEFIRRLRDEGVRLPPPLRRGRHRRGRRLLRPAPRRRARAAAERVVRRRPARPRPDPARRCGAAGAKTPSAQRRARRRVELVDVGEAALAGRAPGRARAARADVAPLHDGARARPPAAPRRRQRPRRDRARRPRRRRRPRRLVARARGRAARRARPRRPPARPLRRAARPHPGAAEARSRARPGWRCSCSPPASPTARSAG